MKRTIGDMYTNAILLQGYLGIQENPLRRRVIVKELFHILKQADIHIGTIDLNQKLGKVEFLMTQGERGTPGIPLLAMQEIVKVYNTDKALFALYVEAFHKNTTVEKLQAKEAAKEKIVHDYEENAAIDVIPFSKRVLHILQENNIRTVRDFAACTEEDFSHIPHISQKNLGEILEFFDVLQKYIKKMKEEEAKQVALKKKDSKNKLKALLAQGVRRDANVLSLPVSTRTKHVLYYQKVRFLQQLQDIPFTSWEKVRNCGAKTLEELRLLYGLLGISPNEKTKADEPEVIKTEVSKQEDTPTETVSETPYCPTLMEFVEGISKENYKIAILDKLHGETLEKIGARIHVSRERARQIVKKLLDTRPVLQEDSLLPIWDTYRALSDEDYQFIFDMQPETIQYFQLISKSHKEKEMQLRFECLQQIIHDYADNETIVNRAKELMKNSRKFVLIDGEKIEKNRPSLIRYAVRKYCQNEMSFGKFYEKYNEFLKSLSLDTDSKLTIQKDGSLTNRLANASYILWGRGKKLRYYDISSIDGQVLIEEIGLANYKNVEISTQKFFMDYPDVMKEYDIRNAYEMHNLLKKIWDRDQLNATLDIHHQVTFGRMPMISIGQANRNRQVMELLQTHSPIKAHDLAKLYEEFYGVKAVTVFGNFFVDFDQYLNQETFSVNWTPLPDAIRNQMNKILTADFYFLDEVYEIFQQEFPEENVWVLNQIALKEIGFLPYSNYVIRNTYTSAADYFRHILQQPIFDIRDQAYLLSVETFYSLMRKERNNFNIVEAEPLVYNSMEYLNQKGITKDQFYDFWHLIENHVADNEFFTIFSLKKAGLSMPWQEQYFRNWFYSSVLLEDTENFRYQRYGECRLFRKSKEAFSLKDFLYFVVDRFDEEMEFHEFTRYLQNQYGFCPQESRLKEVIASDYELSEKIAVY